ncbi:MAG: exonuclease domain-containing protein [Patescibacteria group bacterium]
MVNLIFFDTETTGNTKNDFLCQLAYKNECPSLTPQILENKIFCNLYKPSIKIPPEASAVHHITNKMVEGKSSFKESEDFLKIKQLFEDENNILVAHNAPFDLMILENEGIKIKNFICTLRLARHLDLEEKIPKYNLQYLRYFLDLDIEAVAHSADGDVLILEKLFERLKNKMEEKENLVALQPSGGRATTPEEIIKKMLEISSHPTLLKSFNFGKYNGQKIEEIAQKDKNYLEWLLAEKLKSDQIDEDWIYTLKHYLGKLNF